MTSFTKRVTSEISSEEHEPCNVAAAVKDDKLVVVMECWSDSPSEGDIERVHEYFKEYLPNVDYVIVPRNAKFEIKDRGACTLSESYEEHSISVSGRTPEEAKALWNFLVGRASSHVIRKDDDFE